MLPSKKGFDDFTIEYPFPFWNPADRRFYVYYLGRRERPPKQTGLLVGDGDFGQWTRVCQTPVIAADTEHERYGSSHPSVVVVDDTIHIIYTRDRVDKQSCYHHEGSAKPIFKGTGQAWDCDGILTPQVIEIDNIYYMVYAGKRGNEWQTGLAKARKELGDDTSTYPNVC